MTGSRRKPLHLPAGELPDFSRQWWMACDDATQLIPVVVAANARAAASLLADLADVALTRAPSRARIYRRAIRAARAWAADASTLDACLEIHARAAIDAEALGYDVTDVRDRDAAIRDDPRPFAAYHAAYAAAHSAGVARRNRAEAIESAILVIDGAAGSLAYLARDAGDADAWTRSMQRARADLAEQIRARFACPTRRG